jgi:hypothetical protein
MPSSPYNNISAADPLPRSSTMGYDDLDMEHFAQIIDYGAEIGPRATSDDASMEEWPLDMISEPRTAHEDELLGQENPEHSFGGTTDLDGEGCFIEHYSMRSFVSRPEEMECDAPATDQDLNMEPYDGYQLLNTQTPITPRADPDEPHPPHSIHPHHPPSGIQDAGAQTGMGMWADSLPFINVQPPSATPGYEHQEVYRGNLQTDTTAAPARYATDNMQSIPNFWAEPGMRPYDPMPDYSQDAMMLQPASSKSPYLAPWNNQDWRETQYASTTHPSCGCAGNSSHAALATSHSGSTTPWTEASLSSFNSIQRDLTDSVITVRPLPMPDLDQRMPYCPHGNPIVYILPDSEHEGPPHAAPATSARMAAVRPWRRSKVSRVILPNMFAC